jgi:hypothetical protein
VSDRPLLLVDIDGVLNPYAAITCPDGYTEYAVFPEDDQPMRLAASHGESGYANWETRSMSFGPRVGVSVLTER